MSTRRCASVEEQQPPRRGERAAFGDEGSADAMKEG